MNRRRTPGYTLAEILVVVAILGCIALVAMPTLRAVEPVRLDAAAEAVAGGLRFAIEEAALSGGYVRVDGGTVPGHLTLYVADASGAALAPLADPLTKRAFDLDVTALSPGAAMTAQFVQGGAPYAQMLVGPAGQLAAYDGTAVRGAIEAGSGVVLARDGASVTVAVNELTGRVTVP